MKHNSILMVAYHYPPAFGSSGLHRTVAFSNQLVASGWEVDILSASLKAYERVHTEASVNNHKEIRVHRAFARNTATQLAIKGKYSRFMSVPDRWQSWIIPAVIKGLGIIRKQKTKVIFSTYPIASAHVIAYFLHRLTGVPWVADFRDPMAQDGYPSDPLNWKAFKWIEEKAAQHASKLVFVTPGALAEYQTRYPAVGGSKWQLIANGYDEAAFEGLIKGASKDLAGSNRVTILHSGLVYTSERNPTQLFDALSELKQEGAISAQNFCLRLRASGHEKIYAERLQDKGIDDLIELVPAIPYKEALQEMMDVDGLLLMQGAGCNQQIPAKAYEYLRTQQPVLVLTDAEGDTAKLFQDVGIGLIKPLNNTGEIKDGIVKFINQVLSKNYKSLPAQEYQRYSRSYGAATFVSMVENLN